MVGVEVRVGEALFDCVPFAGIDYYWSEEGGRGVRAGFFGGREGEEWEINVDLQVSVFLKKSIASGFALG